MPNIALYAAATVFTALGVLSAALYAFDTDILVGSTLYRPLNMLAAAILFALLAAWMIIAILDLQSDK